MSAICITSSDSHTAFLAAWELSFSFLLFPELLASALHPNNKIQAIVKMCILAETAMGHKISHHHIPPYSHVVIRETEQTCLGLDLFPFSVSVLRLLWCFVE